MAIVTITEVRNIIGVGTDIVPDSVIQDLIDFGEESIKGVLKINTTPEINIDILKPDHNPRQQLYRKHPLKILELQVGTRTVDPKTIYLDYISGLISYKPSAQEALFTTSRTERIKVKYLNAFISKDESNIGEIITTDITSGDNKVVTVEGGTYVIDDYFMFEGLDGSLEVAKVTAVNGSDITFDSLVNDYSIGSLLTKIEPNKVLKRFLLYEASLAAANYAIGASYTFATGYTYPEYSVQKGVPYPHFEKVVNEIKPLRNEAWTWLQNNLISIM